MVACVVVPLAAVCLRVLSLVLVAVLVVVLVAAGVAPATP